MLIASAGLCSWSRTGVDGARNCRSGSGVAGLVYGACRGVRGVGGTGPKLACPP